MTAGPVTAVNTVMGTAPYMSPEQAESKPGDERSDVFSAGAVLYEMPTGKRAFDGDSMLTILSKVLRDTPAPVRGLRADAPAAVQDVVERCLDKDPAARYASGRELALALAACQPGPRTVRRGLAAAAAADFLVIAAGLGGWLYLRYSRSQWVCRDVLPQVRTLIAKDDFIYPVEQSQKPLFRLLGSPAADKKHALFEGGHVTPLQGRMGETLAWLDKYLGPVDGAR